MALPVLPALAGIGGFSIFDRFSNIFGGGNQSVAQDITSLILILAVVGIGYKVIEGDVL